MNENEIGFALINGRTTVTRRTCQKIRETMLFRLIEVNAKASGSALYNACERALDRAIDCIEQYGAISILDIKAIVDQEYESVTGVELSQSGRYFEETLEIVREAEKFLERNMQDEARLGIGDIYRFASNSCRD